jgi:hypothetical protein
VRDGPSHRCDGNRNKQQFDNLCTQSGSIHPKKES